MILITGGTGFIGRALVRHLVYSGKQVRILLRPSPTSPNLPRGVSVEVAVSALNDERGLRAAMKGVEVIYHLAGVERKGSHADLSGVDIEGTRFVAQAAAEANIERIFLLSHLGADRASAFPVLKAKALAENFIIHSGVPYTIFRTAAVFGPGDQFTTSLARLLARAPGVFFVPGSGNSLLQPLWIEDLVACLAWALEDERMINQTYAIGGGEYLTFRSICQTILTRIGRRRFFISLPPPYLRFLSLYLEQSMRQFPISIFWLDYLAADRTCPVDTLPRLFGLMQARFGTLLDYLTPISKQAARK